MTATLTFTLPEETTEHMLAVKAPDMSCDISEFMATTRSWVKYGNTFKTPEEAIQACRDLLSNYYDI